MQTSLVRSGLLALGAILLTAACSQEPAINPEERCRLILSGEKTASEQAFPYQLSKPHRTLTLVHEMKEISGLSWLAKDGALAAVQDELGMLYVLSPRNGKIQQRIRFGKDGDYEGIETAGTYIFAVRSSGTIYRFEGTGSGERESITFKNFLRAGNDVEGLAYDAAGGRLLLACKGMAGGPGQFPLTKAVYAFSLERQELDSIPVLCIPKDTLQAYVSRNIPEDKREGFLKALDKTRDGFGFNPSGMAIHPITGHWYLISANEGFLLVVDPESGRIAHLERLKGKLLEQAEGICFDPDGTLYISSEGNERQAVIQVFRPN